MTAWWQPGCLTRRMRRGEGTGYGLGCLEKIGGLKKFKNEIIEGTVVLHKDHKHQDSDQYAMVEARLYYGKNLVYATEKASVMREAIDLIAEKLERQLIKHQGKQRQVDREAIRKMKESEIE